MTACSGIIFPQAVSAWESHQTLMPSVIAELKQPGSPFQKILKTRFQFVDPELQLARYDYFSQILLLHPDFPGESLSAKDFTELLIIAVDDPDQGMDRNLPDSSDPSNDRKYMGGSEGPSSQGFRHMYFGGWRFSRPIASFQIPSRTLGQSPDRIELLANEAKKLIQSGDYLWGLRILAWSMHYAQDLTQPFHTTQVPSLKMIPWKNLFQWPPQAGLEALIKESTRSLGNYHRSFEIFVRNDLEQKENSVLQTCLNAKSPTLLYASPRELAMALIAESEKRAQELGQLTYDYFGPTLMDPGIDLIRDPKKLPVPTGQTAEKYRKKLNELTCESLKLAQASTLWLMYWALHR